MNKEEILDRVDKLIVMYKNGELGGEVMPEDANPHFESSSLENYLYFTLPMALNYQRNSYTLWESALKTYTDEETRFVFDPKLCLQKSFEEVQHALTKYKVALQKQKQTEIWLSLCNTFVELFNGDIRKLFDTLDNDVDKIRNFIQKDNKKKFPYLSGTKICNYWMYVIYQYTDRKYKNIENLTVAPDTHVCKATHKLGLITNDEFNSSNVQQIVIDRWQELFKNTKYKPIDIHTPLWLWSRNGFKEVKKVKKQVSELLNQDNSGHGIDHINRVLELSLKFAEKENANKDIVSLIALLHDVDDYKLFGMDNAENLTNAKKIMEDCNVDKNTQEQVCLALNNIGYSKRLKGFCPTTLEGKIVSDADMCDALGANGILRVYTYSLKNEKPFFNKDIFPIEDMTAEKYTRRCADSSVCHIFEKILKLKSLMLTKSGKEEAKSRHQIIVDFLYHLFDEENVPEWTRYLNEYLKLM